MKRGKRLPVKLLLLVFFTGLSRLLSAQTQVAPDVPLPEPDSTVRSKVVVSEIRLIGNKITHPRIVYRELIFMKGDTIPLDLLLSMAERSRENLMNTQLFNFVDVHVVREGPVKAEVVIIMTERWYVFPIPIFEVVDRNFNEWWKTRSIARTVYGLQIKWENFRGRNEALRVSLRFGYTENFSLYYNIPYLNRNQTDGLGFFASLSRNHEVAYSLTGNKLNYFKSTGPYIRHDFLGGIRYNHRGAIYNTTSIYVEYRNNSVSDTVIKLNPEFFKPGYRKQQLINVGVQFRRDVRDYVEYPLKGYYFDLEVLKQGLGQFRNEPDQFIIGSSFRKYVEIARRWHAAGLVKVKLTGQRYQSFNNTRALGYNADFVRGYEYYVINGQNFFLFKTNGKFTLLPKKVIKATWIPSEKFSLIPFSIHMNAYIDGAFVRDRQFSEGNPLANTWLFGYGMGLDFVTYYNIILRMEYSFNKMGEKGLFIHFAAPI